MIGFKITGGARIGLTNLSWPFATLTVTRNKLKIKLFLMGSMEFLPTDIVSIVPHSGFSSNGLKINHNIKSYSKKIIFWTSVEPADILKKIDETGFLTLR